ncbi:MAG TPA: zinc-ribbon domain-containing protein [Verrucomicrobiae bacterium]|jgi:predicted Zn finger-like uncharacterized protein|nr:zinc-ribbon domain-containing protein [Verrucomicrobiae bacterium]
MLVQCPGCHTTYRVSEDAFATSKPVFRCSRCKHVFDLGAKNASKPARDHDDAPPAASVRTEELSFSFPSATAHDEAPQQNEEKISELPASASDTNGPIPREDEAASRAHAGEEDWSLFPERAAAEEFAPRAEKHAPRLQHHPAEPAFVFARERQPVSEDDGQRTAPAKRPLSVTPFFLLGAMVLLSCAIVTLVHQSRPEAIENVLRTLPFIGSSISKNDYLRQGIVLQTNLTRFQRIQGNREVFLLSGVAVNRNRVKVREVKVEGYTFGRDGQVLERQVITIGNAISPKIIRDLTQQEILDLQKQSPVKRFEIQPDESASFSIVFLKTNNGAQSFGYRVLTAEEA